MVVSDFDGTITTLDLVAALTLHADPANASVIQQINRRELELRPGLNRLFSTLATKNRDAYLRYLRHIAVFRPGYQRFRHELAQAGIPFYIVSNGLDFILDAVLDPEDKAVRIANRANFTGPFLAIDWEYPCRPPCPGGCGLCKHAVVNALRARHGLPVVFVGDGLTDLNGARAADAVYARGMLADLLTRDGIPFTPFDTFDDILTHLFLRPEVTIE